MNPFSKISELFSDWKFLVNQKGFRIALPEIASDVIHLPYRHIKFYILEYPLSNLPIDIPPKISIIIRPLDFNDIPLIMKINRPSEAKQCKRRLNNGDKGLVAVYQDEVVGYAWGTSDIKPDVEKVPIVLKPNDFLCTDMFTATKFRGKGIQTSLSLARFRLYKDLGFKNAICYIEINNKPSLAVWKNKFKARIIGKINFLRMVSCYKIRILYDREILETQNQSITIE